MSAVVYRMYDEAGALLYVGTTTRWPNRIRQHACHKPWFADVTSVIALPFDDLDAALDAERDAQEHEAPLYNRHRAPRRGQGDPSRVALVSAVPVDLATRLREAARTADRSLAGEIRLALRAWVDEPQKSAA